MRGKLDKTRNPEKPSLLVNELLDMEKLVEEAKARPKESAKNAGGKKPAQTGQAEEQTGQAAPGSQKAPSRTATSQSAADRPAAVVPSVEKRVVHIRLNETAAETDAPLISLRDTILEKPGPCAVFIHLPLPAGETVIRTTSQISASAETEALDTFAHCAGVMEAWVE